MLRILLIDDNPHDRLLAIRALEREFTDIQVQQIIRATEFEQALSAGEFDLVITDYQLGWSNGLKILRAIKSLYPHYPVIMFTNSGSQEIAVEAMKLGLDDYVIKSPKHYTRLPIAVRLAWERFETQRKVAALEIRFQTLLNQLKVGVYRLTTDGVLLEGNYAFLQLLGLNSLPEIPENQTLEPYFQPEAYAELLHQLQQDAGVREQEVQLRRADGSVIWVRISKTFTTIDHTTVIDGLIEDITARKQAEQEREQLLERERAARAEVEAANRVKDEFLAILSHELRSPLNPILGWSKLLTTHKLDETKTKAALAIIERNATLQAQLIEDLLNVSQILQGKLSLNIYSVNLVSIISAALEIVQLAAEAKKIEIHTVLPENIGLVLGDPTRLQQVVWNLLANAVKFTPIGGRVEIRLEQVDTQAQIQVIDTGQGISSDFLPHVFDYFRQADSKTNRKFGGLGLGLAIVKHLVEMHGGTVWAESPGEGKGATFTVRLPLMTVQPQTIQITEQPSNRLDLSGIQVLVVDDEVDSRELVTFLLENHGARVVAVGSAFAAMKALVHSKPDVLVLDIGMPEIDGYMLLRQIRSLPPEQGGQIPAIALTAYAGELNQQQALKVGFQRHMAKPITPEKLLTIISQLVKST
ncbi:MAG: response regulator [Nodularia sp. CChRGM 3473]